MCRNNMLVNVRVRVMVMVRFGGWVIWHIRLWVM
jgi:hypothetical protein